MRVSKAQGTCLVCVASLVAFAIAVLLVKERGIEGMLLSKGYACSKEDIVIYQGEAPPLPSGIPAYAVQIMNICASDCSIANIRLHCGWFSSARLINPRLFRRIGYDDCLVNDGLPLPPASSISFHYANTFPYPLSVASVAC